MAISKELVFKACEQLDAEGKAPTLKAVRQALGNTGSYTTITAWVREWQSQRTASTPAPSLPVPETLTTQAASLVGALWANALSVAQHEFDEQREANATQLQEFEKSAAEALALADQHAEELAQATAELERLRAIERQHLELQHSARSAEQQHQVQLEAAQERASSAVSQRDQAQAAAHTAEARAIQAEAEVTQTRTAMAELKLAHSETVKALESVRVDAAVSVQELERLRPLANQTQQLSVENADMRGQLSSLNASLESTSSDLKSERARAQELSEQLAVSRASAVQSAQEAERLQNELSALIKTIGKKPSPAKGASSDKKQGES